MWLTGEALTHSSLLEEDSSGDSVVNMTTVEPMSLNHDMLRTQGRRESRFYSVATVILLWDGKDTCVCDSGPSDPVVVLSPHDDLVTMTTGHTYTDDVVTLL